jgi:hypothetical protein
MEGGSLMKISLIDAIVNRGTTENILFPPNFLSVMDKIRIFMSLSTLCLMWEIGKVSMFTLETR